MTRPVHHRITHRLHHSRLKNWAAEYALTILWVELGINLLILGRVLTCH